MGAYFSSLFYNWLMRNQGCSCGRDYRVLIIGLDNAGKTTILYKMKLGEVVETIPTIGFNVETLDYKKLRFTVWDVGGQAKIRQLWRHYYQNTRGIIYVIDSADKERLEEAKAELHTTLKEEELQGIPVLVFANKQDLPNAISSTDLGTTLNIDGVGTQVSRRWHVQACNALKGTGLMEGLEWLAKQTEAHSHS